MASAAIRVKGLRETVRSLERFGAEVSDLKAAFTKIGNLVVDEAKVIAPRRSGKLASTIVASKTKNKSIVRAGRGIEYAGVIHYGWPSHGIEPHPFLTTAVEHQQQAAIRTLDAELNNIIRKLDLN